MERTAAARGAPAVAAPVQRSWPLAERLALHPSWARSRRVLSVRSMLAARKACLLLVRALARTGMINAQTSASTTRTIASLLSSTRTWPRAATFQWRGALAVADSSC